LGRQFALLGGFATTTLLRARGLGHLTSRLFDIVLGSTACRLVWIDAGRFTQTRALFERHADQPWSFTDCSSFVVMGELGLRDALTKDAHFKTAGFRPLLL